MLFLKGIRVLLLSIIIFMLAAGNTFAVVSYRVSYARARREALQKLHDELEESASYAVAAEAVDEEPYSPYNPNIPPPDPVLEEEPDDTEDQFVIDQGVAPGATKRTYTTNADFDEGILYGIEHDTVSHQLQLLEGEVTNLPYIWVPNGQGTISKVHTITGNELGRYWVSPHSGSPSRTTVDLQGNCWVGNRGAGTVVKVGLYENDQWMDRNGDGVCQTSQDLDGDGNIAGGELLPWGADECVLYEVVLISGRQGTYAPGEYTGGYDYNGWGTAPRGLAIDKYNNLWAGTWSSRTFYYIDGETGEIIKSLRVSHESYGAVIDANGIVWSSTAGRGAVLRLDPSTDPPTTSTIYMGHTVYGVGLDYNNNLFTSGWTTRRLSKVDTVAAEKIWTKSKSELDRARGVASTGDNDIWVASTGNNSVYRYDNDGNLKVRIFTGSAPTGVAVDDVGKVWACGVGDDYLYRIDPATNTVDLSKELVGTRGHYSYSDMTGMIARSITTRNGTWRIVHDSGTLDAPWGLVSWNSDEPEGTAIVVKARSSNDRKTWSGSETVENGVLMTSTPNGRFLEVEVGFQILSEETSPILYDLTIQQDEPPIADAGGPYADRVGGEMTFDGSGSYDPNGTELAEYIWDFGDGSTGQGVKPDHTYTSPGVYNVTLMVSDGKQYSDPDATMSVISIQTVQVDLGQGWSIISLPVNPLDGSLPTVLASIDGLYNSLWTYDATTGDWLFYYPNGVNNGLTVMEPGRGYWIDMAEPATLIIAMLSIADQPIALKKGWNMVGYSSLVSQPRADAMIPIDGMYDSVWTYYNAIDDWSLYALSWLCEDAWVLNTLDQLEPWKGYWINSLVDTPDVLFWHKLIPNDPPVADANGPYQTDMGDGVVLSGITLDGSVSWDPDFAVGDHIVTYRWDVNADGIFGDVAGINPMLTPQYLASLGINTPGVFPVVLEVQDTFLETDVAAAAIQVSENVPEAVADVIPPEVAPDELAVFDHSGSWHNSLGHGIALYEWDFESDGVSDYSTVDALAAPQHSYPFVAGSLSRTETATLRVTDDNFPERTDTDTVDVIVSFANQPPTAEAGGPYPVELGLGVTLDGSGSIDPDEAYGDSVAIYDWDMNRDGVYGDVTGVAPTLTADELEWFGIYSGTYEIGLQVQDSFGAMDTDVATIVRVGAPVANAVVEPSEIPRNDRNTTVVTFDASVSDGDSLTYDWNIPDGAFANGSSSSSQIASVTFLGDVEQYFWELTVSNFVASDQTGGIIIVRNDPPVANAGPNRSARIGETYVMDGSGSMDPNDDPITYEWSFISIPPESAAVLDDPTSATPSFVADPAGQYVAQLVVRDHELTSNTDTVTIVAEEDYIRPEVDVTVTPPIANVGDDVTITVNAEDNMDVITSKTLTVNGAPVPLDASGTATYTSDTAGVFTAVGKALDLKGYEGYDSEEFRFLGPDDGIPPTVDIISPDDNSEISNTTDVVATIVDDDLVRYKLEYSVKGKDTYITIASGDSQMTNGVPGQLDPTIMLNGLYDVRLTAEDAGGNTASTTRTYRIVGEKKLGFFTLRFEDISIPVAGIPITVIRTYDSRNKAKGDFGIGWTLDVSDVVIGESGTLGEGWELQPEGGLIPSCTIQQTEPHYVTVTYPDGGMDMFYMNLSTVNWPFCPQLRETQVSYTPAAGTYSSLMALADNSQLVMGNSGEAATLQDYGFNIYDPESYQLTALDGTVFVISEKNGLESIQDPNGNSLTFSSNGITHSAGKGIMFNRDGEKRIVAVTDPLGYRVQYEYDFYGDLVRVTDQEGNVTKFIYDSNHYLLDIIDPLGNRGVRCEYDADGRLVRQIDADGKVINYDHDLAGQQEVITDRLGNTTIYKYDDRGNVVESIDALGNPTSYTYDENDNELTKTDALGNTETFTYDANNNLLSSEDPLGNVTTYTYDDQNRMLTTTDPFGNTTSSTYDASGLLESVTRPSGTTTTYEYDPAGNLISTTDDKGNNITSQYSSAGHLTRQSDSEGNLSTYSYDANGNPLAYSSTGTNAQGETVTVTVTKVYDSMNRAIQTTDQDGDTIFTEYNALGQKSAVIDENGDRTAFEYDSRGNNTKITYPDGTTEVYEFDANGNKISTTDREGQTTRYEFDALGRPIHVFFNDGTSTGAEYDAVGQTIADIDTNGNRTEYEYDAGGRKAKITDALGNETRITHDKRGKAETITDAKNHVTGYEYNESGHRIKTIFDDGTFIGTEYDKQTRTLTETDLSGNVTLFKYDPMNRLTNVIDANGGQVSSIYDKFGNRTSITDANGHINRWEYDESGRVTKHILPLGMFETYTYDTGGAILGRTDFNGNTVAYSYDPDSNSMTKTYPDGTQLNVTYTESGNTQTVTDTRGTTSYTYDQVNRLTEVVNPDGLAMSYGYDNMDNRTTITTPSGTTRYTYDALGRLSTVRNPDGGVTTYTYDEVGNRASMIYPNGVATTYSYDSLNRLIFMETRRANGDLISSHDCTLGLSGNRTKVVEQPSGRTIDYTYDALYRLTKEEITDPILGNGTVSYTYDAVGNRLTMTDSTGTTMYSYDANDRLLTEVGPTYNCTYTYDNNGNMLSKSDGVTTANYTYDYEDRLVSVQTNGDVTNYQYDMDGIRVRSETNGVVTSYLVDKKRAYAQVLEERNTNGVLIASYVYGDDLISQNRGGSLYYYCYDGLGSTRALTDGTGNATDTYTYDAFGKLAGRTGNTPNSYLFTGEQYDANVKSYYLRARYYCTDMGRFLTMDPLSGTEYDPRSLHKYAYSYNNPSNYADPSGAFPVSAVQMAVTFGIIGAMMAIVILPFVSSGVRNAYAKISDFFPDALMLGLSGTLPAGDWLKIVGKGAWKAAGTIAQIPPIFSFSPETVAVAVSLLRALPPHVLVATLGVEDLHIVSSAQQATYIYVGGAAGFQSTKSHLEFGLTLNIGGVWNLWNADDYTGWFSSMNLGLNRHGVGLFWDPGRKLNGPYGISYSYALTQASGKGGQFSRTYYWMTSSSLSDSMFVEAAYVATVLGALGTYLGAVKFKGGLMGGFWGAVGGIFLGSLWGSTKWSYNQYHKIPLCTRQVVSRDNFVWKGDKGGWQGGAAYRIMSFLVGLGL